MEYLILYLVVGCLITATEHKIDKKVGDLQENYYYFLRPVTWLFSLILLLITPSDDLEV